MTGASATSTVSSPPQRREHKGLGVYPEDHLWRATHGYLDLLAATRAAGST